MSRTTFHADCKQSSRRCIGSRHLAECCQVKGLREFRAAWQMRRYSSFKNLVPHRVRCRQRIWMRLFLRRPQRAVILEGRQLLAGRFRCTVPADQSQHLWLYAATVMSCDAPATAPKTAFVVKAQEVPGNAAAVGPALDARKAGRRPARRDNTSSHLTSKSLK